MKTIETIRKPRLTDNVFANLVFLMLIYGLALVTCVYVMNT